MTYTLSSTRFHIGPSATLLSDWQIEKAGNLHINVSKMSDQRYEFLIGTHDVIEGYLAIHAGVLPEAVDKFDRAY